MGIFGRSFLETKKSREIWLKGGDRNIVLKGSRHKVLLEPETQGAPKVQALVK